MVSSIKSKVGKSGFLKIKVSRMYGERKEGKKTMIHTHTHTHTHAHTHAHTYTGLPRARTNRSFPLSLSSFFFLKILFLFRFCWFFLVFFGGGEVETGWILFPRFGSFVFEREKNGVFFFVFYEEVFFFFFFLFFFINKLL